jgi:hypothetical protein
LELIEELPHLPACVSLSQRIALTVINSKVLRFPHQSVPVSEARKHRQWIADVIVRRTRVIEHHDGFSPGTQYAPNFAERSPCIGSMVKYSEGVDNIELLIGEGEILCVAGEKVSRNAFELKPLSSQSDASGG